MIGKRTADRCDSANQICQFHPEPETCLPIQAGYDLYKERRMKLKIDSGINRKRKREEAQL